MSYNLQWYKFDKGTVPLDRLLLCETKTAVDEIEYHTGAFTKDGNGNPFGVVGGHFHFDRDILRYAVIEDLKPKN